MAVDVDEARRLLNFALFNLHKGKLEAACTLIEKARLALGATEKWDGLQEEGYEADDPKSEGYHERTADLWDMRER